MLISSVLTRYYTENLRCDILLREPIEWVPTMILIINIRISFPKIIVLENQNVHWIGVLYSGTHIILIIYYTSLRYLRHRDLILILNYFILAPI